MALAPPASINPVLLSIDSYLFKVVALVTRLLCMLNGGKPCLEYLSSSIEVDAALNSDVKLLTNCFAVGRWSDFFQQLLITCAYAAGQSVGMVSCSSFRLILRQHKHVEV